mmetsp:Transcript_74345/g.177337  ORF Transcript_74345/g.177337 Transcript_74345/m.177337 type:complete len:90 (-) Transcript_74345:3537-3806(-)
MVVLPTRASCIASCTKRSEVESSADVASSRSMNWGRRSKARAMATRCFCPPDSFSPRSPTRSAHFTFPAKTKSMFAALAASVTCSSVAS